MRPDRTTSRSHHEGSSSFSLLDRLHKLLSRLNDTTEAIKTWPDSGEGDNTASVAYEATTELIESIHDVVRALKAVEDKLQRANNGDDDPTVRKQVLDSQVPLDLLDLMDYGNGLNPECFTKQLIREALRHLSGLRRRKVALEMLGRAIEAGLKKRDNERASEEKQNVADERRRPDGDNEDEKRGTKRSRTNRASGGHLAEDAGDETRKKECRTGTP